MKYLYLLFLLPFVACNSASENTSNQTEVINVERWQPTDYRNQNWQPEEGKYFFSEQWTWNYINESLPEDDIHRNGEFSLFVDPPTGIIMLNNTASHYIDDMTDWIIVHPDGSFKIGWTDHDGSKSMQDYNMKSFDDYAFRITEQQSEFEEFFSHTGEFIEFGKNEYGWETFMGKEWIQTYKMTNEESTVYTTALPFSVRPLYLIEETNPDLGLPINFKDYAYLLPENELVLKEISTFYGKKVGFEFKSASPTEYFLDVSGYREVK